MHNLANVQEVIELRKRHLQNCNDLWISYEESQNKGIFHQKEASAFEWSNLCLFESLALTDLFFFNKFIFSTFPYTKHHSKCYLYTPRWWQGNLVIH